MSLYLEYFGLKTEPFGLTPNPEFYYATHTHESALEWVRYAVEQHEMGLVIGEIGTGKTVLSRLLVDSLDSQKYRICWIINPQMSPTALLKEVYRGLFQAEPKYFKRDVQRQLTEGLAALYTEGVHPVLIIDEAQSILSKQIFDELRLLSNYQTDAQNLISVILFGQPELATRLKKRAYRALIERIRFSITLRPLIKKEVTSYLLFRMQKAGLLGAFPFTDEAVRSIHELSKGIPRVINHIATFALMQTMTEELTKVDAEQVKAAAGDILYLENEVK